MKIFLTICAFINSWFGTTFGEPSKTFRRREYYRCHTLSKNFISMLNQHLLLHQFLYDLIPDGSAAKFEHDEAVRGLLYEHILSRAAWYNDDVFKYVSKEIKDIRTSVSTLPFCLDPLRFNYPLYEFTTSDSFTSCLETTSYVRHSLNDNPPNMKRDSEGEPRTSHILDLVTDLSLNQLSRLDTDLVDTVLHRYILALDDTSIINDNNTQVTLSMIKGIQKVLEAICFMRAVYIKPGRADQLIEKLTLCNQHRYGISPNEDNPTQRCLTMLTGGQFNRGIILSTYLVRERTDIVTKLAMRDISESGSYVYTTYSQDNLLGKASQSMSFGPRHQWFQVFEFNRMSKRPKTEASPDRLVYRDEILDFKQMLFEDKSLDSWRGAIITDLEGIPTGEVI